MQNYTLDIKNFTISAMGVKTKGPEPNDGKHYPSLFSS
jgi:hypothetical protein